MIWRYHYFWKHPHLSLKQSCFPKNKPVLSWLKHQGLRREHWQAVVHQNSSGLLCSFLAVWWWVSWCLMTDLCKRYRTLIISPSLRNITKERNTHSWILVGEIYWYLTRQPTLLHSMKPYTTSCGVFGWFRCWWPTSVHKSLESSPGTLSFPYKTNKIPVTAYQRTMVYNIWSYLQYMVIP